ncbi:MAG: single-stranded DNA-binding protein [Candidatus Adiutrix sp.]
MLRSTVYGNIGKIEEIKTVTVKEKEKEVINISLAENIYNSAKKKTGTNWYRVGLWEENLARFLDANLQVGDYVMMDIFNLKPHAYMDKNGEAQAYMAGSGGYFVLLTKSDPSEAGGEAGSAGSGAMGMDVDPFYECDETPDTLEKRQSPKS